jgi:ABC-type Fe3+-hydroxamate transport system substrate-binding protein
MSKQTSRRPASPLRGLWRGRAATAAVAAMLGCLVLAACGGDDDGGGGSGGGVTASSAESAFPLTIRSKHGSATIAQPPRRVVTLDNQAADDALALGVVPVATVKVTYVPGDMQAWTRTALSGKKTPQPINADSGIPYERIAALRPDLILATNTYQLEEKGAYERLRRIAPTVHFAKGSGTDTWQEAMGRVGQALGNEVQARELVEEAERELAAARKRTPAFEGATVNFFNADPSGLYTINDKQDYAIRFLADLGLRLSPRVAALKGAGGRAQISAERYDILDSDLLIGTSTTPKALAALERDKLFSRLPAVREGGYVPLAIGPATSMAFPSLLSVRWATTEVVPKLEQAIKARAAS